MRNKITFLLCTVLIAAMVLGGCASPAGDLMKGIISQNKGRVPESMNSELNKAILDFTWKLFKESSQAQGNIMISAPSAYFALAMTLNGADNETKTGMLKALSADNISLEELNTGLNDWMTLMARDRTAKFSITNSIWLREGYSVNNNFLQTNADYYSAYIRSLDFGDASAPDEINSWVKETTNGKIDKIVDKISDDLFMYLINAIYFKGDWKEQFSANKTCQMEFKTPTGKVKTDFMNRRGNIEFLKLNDITGVVLPYEDEQFAFVGLLPAEGQTPKDLINDMSALDLIGLLANKKVKNIELSLPKFESTYEDSLKDELSKLGMDIAFQPYSADFSLMREENDLFIGDVKQKTYIKVDEKGTEAAAVTSVEMQLTSMPVELPKVVFDRPFVYGIIDVETGIPLFIGIMENPAIK